MRKAAAAALMLVAGAGGAAAQGQRFEGVSLNLASQNDQFAGVLVKLVPRAKEDLGLDVRVDILSYPELLTKITADFVGNTQGYDLVTMDIVWAGQFAEAGHSVDLKPLIERDRAELDLATSIPCCSMRWGSTRAGRWPTRSPAMPTCWPTAPTSTRRPGCSRR